MTALLRLRRPSHRRIAALFGIAVLLVVLAGGIGFAWFLELEDRTANQLPLHADGIVALTGGPDRVETALRLLAEGRADRLLLSGIGGGAVLPELARLSGVDPIPIATRVTIGRNATTTRGNALETAAWAQSNAIHSLLVVTASYHMPRAMMELGRALPDVTLYPVPVVSTERAGTGGPPLRLIAEEFVKFLASAAGLTSVLPSHEQPPNHGHTG